MEIHLGNGHSSEGLNPSDKDMVALGEAVQERLEELKEAHLRITHTMLTLPLEMKSAFLLWVTMRSRHQRGDLRNTEGEKRATRHLAQWSLDANADLRNQKRKTIEWRD
jgi:hypothetical protein